MLGVGNKPYVYTHRRTQFLDDFGKNMSLMVRWKKGRNFLSFFNYKQSNYLFHLKRLKKAGDTNFRYNVSYFFY